MTLWERLKDKLGKPTSAELAAEILAAEATLPNLRDRVAQTEAQALEVATKRISGVTLGKADADAITAHADAGLNVKAADAGLRELRTRLVASVERERKEALDAADRETAALARQREELIAKAVPAVALLCLVRFFTRDPLEPRGMNPTAAREEEDRMATLAARGDKRALLQARVVSCLPGFESIDVAGSSAEWLGLRKDFPEGLQAELDRLLGAFKLKLADVPLGAQIARAKQRRAAVEAPKTSDLVETALAQARRA